MFAQYRPTRTALAVALCAVVAPLPAMAHDPVATPVVSPEPAARSQTRVCIGRTVTGAQEITGSMLQRRLCKTREQWEAEGVKFEKRDAKSGS